MHLAEEHIDESVTVPLNPAIAMQSLRTQKIVISDTIKSCCRNDMSALDLNLHQIEYNTEMIQEMVKSGVNKIRCTSKWVLQI